MLFGLNIIHILIIIIVISVIGLGYLEIKKLKIKTDLLEKNIKNIYKLKGNNHANNFPKPMPINPNMFNFKNMNTNFIPKNNDINQPSIKKETDDIPIPNENFDTNMETNIDTNIDNNKQNITNDKLDNTIKDEIIEDNIIEDIIEDNIIKDISEDKKEDTDDEMIIEIEDIKVDDENVENINELDGINNLDVETVDVNTNVTIISTEEIEQKLNKIKCDDLRKILSDNNIPYSGPKDKLIKRIIVNNLYT